MGREFNIIRLNFLFYVEKLSGQSNSSKWITPSLSNWHDVLKHIKEAEVNNCLFKHVAILLI